MQLPSSYTCLPDFAAATTPTFDGVQTASPHRIIIKASNLDLIGETVSAVSESMGIHVVHLAPGENPDTAVQMMMGNLTGELRGLEFFTLQY